MTPELRPFHKGLEAVRADVAEMGRLAARSLEDGTRALADRDPERAMAALRRDDALDRLDVDLERRLVDLIARHQPMARDVRVLGGSLKVITYLDRIGRYGYDIAVAALTAMGNEPEGSRAPVLPRGLVVMGEKAVASVLLAVEAYEGISAALAARVVAADDEVDQLYDEVFRTGLTCMMEDPRHIPVMAQHLLVARHLERAGDNAVKVAEKVHYMATGERRRLPGGGKPGARAGVGAGPRGDAGAGAGADAGPETGTGAGASAGAGGPEAGGKRGGGGSVA